MSTSVIENRTPMEQFKDTIALIVGINGQVTMPNTSSILITHSKGEHWFRIYPDARPNSELVFLLDDQGGIQAVARPKWEVADFLFKLFGPRPKKDS
jgi:hypothetical protein